MCFCRYSNEKNKQSSYLGNRKQINLESLVKNEKIILENKTTE